MFRNNQNILENVPRNTPQSESNLKSSSVKAVYLIKERR